MGTAHADCTGRNLLSHLRPSEIKGVLRPDVITDGEIPVQGSAYNGEHSAVFLKPSSEVTWDLGEVRTIRAVYIQADNNDLYVLSISTDGHTFQPVFKAPMVPKTVGMQGRIGQGVQWKARYVRLQPLGGDGAYGVGELGLYCKKPNPFPPQFQVVANLPHDPMGEHVRFVASLKAALALALIPLLFAMVRMRRRPRIALGVFLVVFGMFAWTRFGRFHEDLIIHPWDAFHYFVGAKYFRELGYTQLYNCLAEHEREAGRMGPILHERVRNLEDNVMHVGSWFLTKAGSCKAHFTPARKRAFDADLDAFRPLFPARLPFWRMVIDHGYNGTPFETAYLTLLTYFTPASRPILFVFITIDALALFGAFWMMWWGFGPRVAAMSALVAGLAAPWNYLWTGGCLTRCIWVFFLCAGVALVARRREALGASSLTISGLLRLFPGLFVGAMGLFVIIRAVRDRVLTAARRKVLVVIFATLVAGIVAGGLAAGFGSYRAFYHDMQSQTHIALTNHVGLEEMISYLPELKNEVANDPQLSDPQEILTALQLQARRDRSPLWVLGIIVALAALIAYSVKERARPWVAVLFAGPLVFASIALSNYDYMWLIVLTPLAVTSRFRIAWLLSFVAATQIRALYITDVLYGYFLLSAMTGTMLTVFFVHYWHYTACDPDAEAAALEAERLCLPVEAQAGGGVVDREAAAP